MDRDTLKSVYGQCWYMYNILLYLSEWRFLHTEYFIYINMSSKCFLCINKIKSLEAVFFTNGFGFFSVMSLIEKI